MLSRFFDDTAGPTVASPALALIASQYLLNLRPFNTEARQVFAQPVSIVRTFFACARCSKKDAAGFGKRMRSLAYLEDASKLSFLELVQLVSPLDSKHPLDNSIPIGCRPALPSDPEPSYLFLHGLDRNTPARGERRHADYRSVQVAKVACPESLGRRREFQELEARFLIKGDPLSVAFCILVEFVLQVGFYIFDAVAQARQPECPKVDASKQIFSELTIFD